MLAPHESFETPDSSTVIWRYMGLEKFLDLLTTSKLWFSRCDCFEDKWEGHFSPATKDEIFRKYNGTDESKEQYWQRWCRIIHQVKKRLFVNCWHISKDESPALWRLYSLSDKCVAIQTTVHQLRNALLDSPHEVYAGRVSYLDYKNDPIDLGNVFNVFLRKRLCFDYEKEMRLVYWDSLRDENALDQVDDEGFRIDVKLENLLQNVYVSPYASNHLQNSIDFLVKKIGLSRVSVLKSEVLDGPFSVG